MISFNDIENYKHEKLISTIHQAIQGCVELTHSKAAALIRVHPKFKSAYVVTSDIKGLDGKGIYSAIEDKLESNEIQSFQLNQFGNIEGSFYCTLSRLNNDNAPMFLALLSSTPATFVSIEKKENEAENDRIQSSPEHKSPISIAVDKNIIDVDTVMEHVSASPYIESIKSLKFSIEKLDDDSIFELVIEMFFSILNDSELAIDRREFILFIEHIRSLYNNVPYHNWRHAVDATQFVYFVLSKPEITQNYLPIHKFSLLLSSICHDVGHDGKTNDFHRKTNSQYAQESGETKPPLEFHHQATCLSLLSNQFKAVIENLTQEQKDTLNLFVSEIILATDMSRHKYFVDKINEISQTYFDGSEEQRLISCQAIMKLADLSNTCRLFDEASDLAGKLRDEWYIQGDAENKLGLPISNGFDRNNESPLCKGQVGFYKFVTQGLLEANSKLFKVLDDCVTQFNSNLNQWETLCARLA